MLDRFPLDHRNRFDDLRIFAAMLVIISHSWPLFGHNGSEPIRRLTGHLSGGEVAVMIFFVISGFLVYRSAERSTWQRFILSRGLRIVPGATVCALICVFVVGASVTTLPLVEYFSDLKTWEFLKNSVPFKVQYRLPGVFEGLPHARAVNGSLWTLPKELGLYVVCGLIVFVVRRRIVVLAWLVASGLLLVSVHDSLVESRWYWFVLFGWYFFFGAALYIWRSFVPVSGVLALGALIVVLVSMGQPIFPVVLAVTLPYLVIYTAFAGTGRERFLRFPDISYGVYIYGFPIQQLVVMNFGGQMSFEFMMVASLAAAAVAGSLSWYGVEKPALTLKKHLSRAKPARLKAAE